MSTRRSPSATTISSKVAEQPQQEPATLDECRRCRLWQDATQGVAGKGPQRARIMMVGEQPGDKEDLAGEPFVGPAGALLDSALREAGISRDEVYLTNAVKHFKWTARGKRRLHKTPAQREIDACRYWLDQELSAVQPRVVVPLGATALRAVLQQSEATLRPLLGRLIEHEGLLVVPGYHPSFVLRAIDARSRDQAYQALVAALRQADQAAGRRH